MALILALDVATNTGVALGDPAKGLPELSSVRFGEQGGSLEEAFAAAASWTEMMIETHRPWLIVWEAPLPPSHARGRTNVTTVKKLMGLPAVIGGAAYRMGFYNLAEADVADIRGHFIGVRNLRREEAKKATMARCRDIGVNPKNDNEGDGFALWAYVAKLHAAQPKLFPCPRARKPKKAANVGGGKASV